MVKKSRRRKAPPTIEKIAALREGRHLPIDLFDPAQVRIGEIPGPDIRAALQLARAYQAAENPGYVVVSVECQQRAQDFYNEHGLARTLDEIRRVGGSLT